MVGAGKGVEKGCRLTRMGEVRIGCNRMNLEQECSELEKA
jgi:hypothetical protein